MMVGVKSDVELDVEQDTHVYLEEHPDVEEESVCRWRSIAVDTWELTLTKTVSVQLFFIFQQRPAGFLESKAMASNSTQAIASGDLVDLVSSSTSAIIYPSDDAILAVLQARFRADLPYTRVGTTNLVVVNPYKTLANVNDLSAKDYEDRCYKDTSLPMVDSPRPLQPHLYEQAAKVYLLMRRRNESQAVITR